MPIFQIKDVNTGEPVSNSQIVNLVVRLVASGAAAFFLYKYVSKVIEILDPTKKQKKASEEKVFAIINLWAFFNN